MSASFEPFTEKQSPDEPLSDLRHRLRTPLNHIIGYADLLLEDSDLPDPECRAQLKVIRENAHLIVAHIQQWLAPGGELSASEKIARLRAEIMAPLDLVIGNAGSLTQRLRGRALLDVLRINVAAMELLSFTHGNDAIGKPRITPSRPSDFLALNAEAFDLVLLDVMMPGMSGFEVLQELKASPALCRLPVIMMSALDELESAAHCIQMGAEDYLLKPLDPVLLRARLHSALERQRLHAAEQERTGELEQATLSLKRANEDLHRFAFAASHDLQEPLRTVTTTLQLLSLEGCDNLAPDQKELVGLAVDASRRMSHLIADLLNYSLASSQDRVPETVDAEGALLDALTNLRQSIEESGAAVTHSALPPVLFDRAQLAQLFQNLIGNAIKYKAGRPPEIHVAATRQGDRWIFSVRDNGMGIDEKYCKSIFEPFRRLHGRNLPGTGLGLAICERIVEGFGGRIWVESVPAQGSAFLFTLRGADEDVAYDGPETR
jgi:two-component system sensor histidine kinase/response regulator